MAKYKNGKQVISQMLPATPDWMAIFHSDEGELYPVPVACWALLKTYRLRKVKRKGKVISVGGWDTRTTGMIPVRGRLVALDRLENFLGYDHPSMDIDYHEVYADKVSETGSGKAPVADSGTSGGMGGMIN